MTTRQQIEEVLAEFEGERISDALINDICRAIYRPVFEPKQGQVIAVRNNAKLAWVKRDFWGMTEEGYFTCRDGGEETEIVYQYARPLNSEELGE